MGIGEVLLKCLAEKRLLKSGFTKMRAAVDSALAIPVRRYIGKSSKIVNNKVVFMSYNNDYICNPRYICEEIIKQELPLDIVWATTKKKIATNYYPNEVRLVVRNSYEYFKEIASAKVWVDNALCFPWEPVPKKKDQFYLQTWHGSMGLKRIGVNDVKERKWAKAAKLGTKWTDLCISNSTFETGVFRETHWPETEILELGHARNDILFADEEEKAEIRARVCEFFGITEDKKIALYAPTFRNGDNTKYYNMNYNRVLDSLEKKFGGDWVLLNRFHFKTKITRAGGTNRKIFGATEYPDMQELMVAADVGITDYSSWICDFVLTGRPGFIYAPDLSSYNKERGFYYPLESTPFPIAENNNELEARILDFDMDEYSRKKEIFLQERGCKENGDAAKKIVEIIKEKCGI